MIKVDLFKLIQPNRKIFETTSQGHLCLVSNGADLDYSTHHFINKPTF